MPLMLSEVGFLMLDRLNNRLLQDCACPCNASVEWEVCRTMRLMNTQAWRVVVSGVTLCLNCHTTDKACSETNTPSLGANDFDGKYSDVLLGINRTYNVNTLVEPTDGALRQWETVVDKAIEWTDYDSIDGTCPGPPGTPLPPSVSPRTSNPEVFGYLARVQLFTDGILTTIKSDYFPDYYVLNSVSSGSMPLGCLFDPFPSPIGLTSGLCTAEPNNSLAAGPVRLIKSGCVGGDPTIGHAFGSVEGIMFAYGSGGAQLDLTDDPAP